MLLCRIQVRWKIKDQQGRWDINATVQANPSRLLISRGDAQRLLDKHLDMLLADAPRRSVLFIDSSKVGADGGCAPCCGVPSFKKGSSMLLRICGMLRQGHRS